MRPNRARVALAISSAAGSPLRSLMVSSLAAFPCSRAIAASNAARDPDQPRYPSARRKQCPVGSDGDGGGQSRGRCRYRCRRLGGDRHRADASDVLAVDCQDGNRILGAVGDQRQCPGAVDRHARSLLAGLDRSCVRQALQFDDGVGAGLFC
jgi:hypothetical protein